MPNNMRVAILSSGLGHVFRGVESWSEEIAYGLKDHEIDVTLFKGAGIARSSIEKVIPCLHRGSPWARRLVRFMPSGAWRYGFGSEVQAEGTTFALAALKDLWKYDIIHTQEPPVAKVVLWAKKIGLLRAHIIIANGTNESVDFLKRFKYVQYLTDYDLQQARRYENVDHQHWFAIPNFVKMDTFRPDIVSTVRAACKIPDDALVVLTVAAVKKEHKRIDYLLREVVRLRAVCNKNIYVMIVGGSTDETPKLISLAREMLDDKAIFLLDQDYSKMPHIYAAADIFALCSLQEMFGIVFLEAMASGLPTLGNTHPVIEWILSGGGECVNMTKDGALAKALEKYLDPVYRAAVGEQARAYVTQHFDRDGIIKRIIEQYQTIIAEEMNRE